MVSADAHVGGRDGSPPRTDELGWDEFEDYVEDVLSAHRFSPGNGRRIASVTRWGRRGDKPDGIDLKGKWTDGRSAVWQRKRYRTLSLADVKKAVLDWTVDADEFYRVFSGLLLARRSRNTRAGHCWTSEGSVNY